MTIAIVITCALFIGACLKKFSWFPNKLIPATIIFLAVVFNVANAWIFNTDIMDAIRIAIVEGFGAIGIHSGIKNTVEGVKQNEDL
jgi:hypothetical protein